jgi:hypothetical protein
MVYSPWHSGSVLPTHVDKRVLSTCLLVAPDGFQFCWGHSCSLSGRPCHQSHARAFDSLLSLVVEPNKTKCSRFICSIHWDVGHHLVLIPVIFLLLLPTQPDLHIHNAILGNHSLFSSVSSITLSNRSYVKRLTMQKTAEHKLSVSYKKK